MQVHTHAHTGLSRRSTLWGNSLDWEQSRVEHFLCGFFYLPHSNFALHFAVCRLRPWLLSLDRNGTQVRFILAAYVLIQSAMPSTLWRRDLSPLQNKQRRTARRPKLVLLIHVRTPCLHSKSNKRTFFASTRARERASEWTTKKKVGQMSPSLALYAHSAKSQMWTHTHTPLSRSLCFLCFSVSLF